jgi:methylase of polypeptide subunit release factors
MDFHRKILTGAVERLLPSGHIFLEIAFDQGELAKRIISEYPQFSDAKIYKDQGGNERVLTAKRV